MSLACNIDQRGRQYRYRIGFVLLLLGVAFALFGSWLLGGRSPWLLGGVSVLGGLFSLFEARIGWCAVRAMGFKTRV